MDFKRRGHGRDAEADTGSSVDKSGRTWARWAFRARESSVALGERGLRGAELPWKLPGAEALLEKWGNGPKKCFAGAPAAESWSWDLQYWEELEEIAAGAGISQHHAPGRQIPLPFTPASPRSKPSIASQDLALGFLFYFFPFLYNSLEGNS